MMIRLLSCLSAERVACDCYSMSDTLPTGQLSNVPWRRTGVKYTNNEAYFDVVEEIDVIIDKSGSTVFAEIQGYVSGEGLHINYVLYILITKAVE